MLMSYDLELDKAVKAVKENNAKKVVIQLPDGLKPEAKKIVDAIEKETGAEVLIYLGSCYGACDFPANIKADLLIQWGHALFTKTF